MKLICTILIAGLLLAASLTTVAAQGSGSIYCDANQARVDTAIGCVPINDTQALLGWLFGWGIGVGGGIALLMVIIASFQIITSSGDPRKLQGGKELMISALSGLILLIFSAFVLRIIGVNILTIFN